MDGMDAIWEDDDAIPENFHEEMHHTALAFRFCGDAYLEFLAGKDEFPLPYQRLEDRYGKPILDLVMKTQHNHHRLQRGKTKASLPKLRG